MAVPAARASILHMLPAHLDAAGVGSERVLRIAALTPADVSSSAVVARAQVCAALDAAARALDRPALGLVLGAAAEPERLGPSGAALCSGPTVAHAIAGHAARLPALQSHATVTLSVEDGRAVWRHHLGRGGGEDPRVLYEGASAFIVATMRRLIGRSWVPDAISFPHACRGDRAAYSDYFDAPVRFGGGRVAAIVFDPAVLAIAVPQRLIQSAEAPEQDPLTADSPPREGPALRDALSGMIEAALPDAVPGGRVCLPWAARTLGLAPRTLQRRLDACGVTFADLLAEVRRSIARERLREGGTGVTELAMALGYSDAAHFIRAFRRWEGLTPTQWRAATGPHRR